MRARVKNLTGLQGRNPAYFIRKYFFLTKMLRRCFLMKLLKNGLMSVVFIKFQSNSLFGDYFARHFRSNLVFSRWLTTKEALFIAQHTKTIFSDSNGSVSNPKANQIGCLENINL